MPESGSRVTFRVHYHAHEEIENPRFGISVESENGFLLSDRTTANDGVVTGRVVGDGYIDCTVDALPFGPGVLLVSVGVTDEHQMRTFDHLYQGRELHVRQSADDDSQGLVRLRGRWTSPVPGGDRELLR
jgi:lipopolysaccharide transport system ATP-binding protein